MFKPEARRFTSAARAAVSIAAALLLAHGSQAAELSAEMKAVVAAANKEGTLKVIWPGNLLGGARGVSTLEQNINKMFGSQIRINHTPTGSLIQLGFQLANEAKANAPASTDVYIAVANVGPMLVQNKVLLPVEWTKLLPGRITPQLVEADGGMLRIASAAYGVTYNTKLLPNPPRTMEGFLAPQFKGKLATNPQAVGIDVLAAKDVMGRDKALDFVRRFSPQVGGLINCTDQNRIGTGEFVAMMFDCGPIDAIKMKEAGLPVDQVLLRDHLQLAYFYGAVPAHSQHPNAAKLLVAYLVTEEGQRLQWDLWREDLHLLPGSRLAERINAALKDGGKPIETTVQWYAARPEIDAARGDVLKILRDSNR